MCPKLPCATTGGRVWRREETGRGGGGAGGPNRCIFCHFLFFLLSSVFSQSFSFPIVSFSVKCNQRRVRTGWDQHGWQKATRDGRQAQRGRQLKKVGRNFDGPIAGEDEAVGRAGRSGLMPGNIAVVLPPPWIFGQGLNIFFSKYNALQIL